RPVGESTDCVLLGEPLPSRMCTAPVTINTKRTVGCPATADPRTLMAEDPCVDELFPNKTRLNQYWICPNDKDENGSVIYYIVRVVMFDGTRKTFFDSQWSWLRYDAAHNSWFYFYNENDVGYKHFIVGASCAIASATKCPCAPIAPAMMPGRSAYPIIPDKKGACPAQPAGLLLYITWGDWYANDVRVQNHGLEMYLTCKAGAWMFYRADNHYNL
ncbi:hypothetical protein PFISCL1PPCAC_8763, partial [Pristionchus fissidentatus]